MTDLENDIRKAILWAQCECDEVCKLLSNAVRPMDFTGDKLYAPSSRPPEYVMAWLSPARASLHIFVGTPVRNIEWQGRLPRGLLA